MKRDNCDLLIDYLKLNVRSSQRRRRELLRHEPKQSLDHQGLSPRLALAAWTAADSVGDLKVVMSSATSGCVAELSPRKLKPWTAPAN